MHAVRITPTVHALQALIDRRTILGTLLLAGCFSAASNARTLAQEATPEAGAVIGGTPTPFSDQVFVGEGFVGEVADLPTGQAFVAVVVAEPQAGEERRAVRVLLYGDRENQIREWFTGEVMGDRLDVVSEAGAQLHGEWSSDGVTGTITLPEGSIIPIDAVPISGPAGLYTVQVFPDGRVEGLSEAGVELAGQVVPETGPNQEYPLAGTLIPPNNPPLPFEIVFFTDRLGAGPPSRLIVLTDGRMLGGSQQEVGDFFDGTNPTPPD